jgi:hypothetical protein
MGLGLVFVTAISPAFISFMGLGVVFLALGLSNRDKWADTKKIA